MDVTVGTGTLGTGPSVASDSTPTVLSSLYSPHRTQWVTEFLGCLFTRACPGTLVIPCSLLKCQSWLPGRP